MESKKFNRIRTVLADKEFSNRDLAKKMGKNENTVSRWTRNIQQPSIETLYEIAEILEVDVCDLLERGDEDSED